MESQQLRDYVALQQTERDLEVEARRDDLDPIARQSVDYHLRVTRDCLRAMREDR
jgi:hypothetical protein